MSHTEKTEKKRIENKEKEKKTVDGSCVDTHR